ncbi:Uu.00g000240.m01.CDS01 [Anthostomella pinea]|uniref:Uu.00g000240.m01.CDS01 n=1 Tax=Anthostomella pinea TaxID=933095 RepID=A0AAI8YID9_9PEZI|nr:Uu.00g000240.m01.CDS01 [Anthostomella pinea]
MPHVRSEISNRLTSGRSELEAMGAPRGDASSQGLYLVKLASRFQAFTRCALDGYYVGEPLFQTKPSLKLITALVKLNERFSDDFWRKGHRQYFESAWDDEGETILSSSSNNASAQSPTTLKE